jgi:hypothetical protein
MTQDMYGCRRCCILCILQCGSPPVCQAVACETQAAIDALTAPPPNTPPHVLLWLPPSTPYLPVDPGASRTYYLPFGQPAPLNLMPCDKGGAKNRNATGCAATARDAEVGGPCGSVCRQFTASSWLR